MRTVVRSPAILLAIALAPSTAFGVQPATVLAMVEEEWAEIESFRAELAHRHLNPEGEVLTEYLGSLSVCRPNRIRIDYRQVPAGTPFDATLEGQFTHVIFSDDAEYLYEYDSIHNIVYRDEAGQITGVPFIETVAGISAFSAEEFRKQYWVTAPVPEEEWGDLAVYLISAHPHREYEEDLRAFDVWIGQDDTIPRKIRVYYPEETVELEILGFEVNPSIPDEFYDFRVPADAEPKDRVFGF